MLLLGVGLVNRGWSRPRPCGAVASGEDFGVAQDALRRKPLAAVDVIVWQAINEARSESLRAACGSQAGALLGQAARFAQDVVGGCSTGRSTAWHDGTLFRGCFCGGVPLLFRMVFRLQNLMG